MTDAAPTEEVEEAEPDLPPPTNVIAAIARVEAEIGGIRKMTKNERQRAGMHVDSGQGVPWAYRGIDQIAGAARPLFGKYGVVIVPTVKRHIVDEIMVNNNPWTDTTVEVKWTIYGPGGVDDKITAHTVGLGRDNSDKGYNKAMTIAYKNLLLRLLSIGDPKDDIDHTQEYGRDAPAPPPAEDDPVHRLWLALIDAATTDERREALKQIAHSYDQPLTEAAMANHATMRGELERQLAEWADADDQSDDDADVDSGSSDEGEESTDPDEPADEVREPGVPTNEWTKTEIEAWLSDRDVAYTSAALKADLLDIAIGYATGDDESDDGVAACVDCGEVGHTAMDCPNPVEDQSTLLDDGGYG